MLLWDPESPQTLARPAATPWTPHSRCSECRGGSWREGERRQAGGGYRVGPPGPAGTGNKRRQLFLPCRCASSILPKARTLFLCCRRLRPPKELRPGQAVGNLFSFPLPIHTAPLKMWSCLASPQGPLSVAQTPLEEGKEGRLEDARIYLVPKLIL